MWGEDFSEKWLTDEGLDMIVRSHECMDEGYIMQHNNLVCTLFSASNYYEDESNSGAYMVFANDPSTISGAEYTGNGTTKPRGANKEGKHFAFVRYIAGIVGETGKLTMSKKAGKLEAEAVEQLRKAFSENRDSLTAAFQARDPTSTGVLSLALWAEALTEVLGLTLPWMSLKDKFGDCLVAGGKQINTEKFLSSFTASFQANAGGGGAMVSDHLYKNRQQLETVFRLMDEDSSGCLSRDEFNNACAIVNECSDGIQLTAEQIQVLADSMDTDGDGLINFSEFLLSFSLMEAKAEEKATG